jgi:hypothetical protein
MSGELEWWMIAAFVECLREFNSSMIFDARGRSLVLFGGSRDRLCQMNEYQPAETGCPESDMPLRYRTADSYLNLPQYRKHWVIESRSAIWIGSANALFYCSRAWPQIMPNAFFRYLGP